ncbi:MAG: glycyl-radical enzyme activating protein family [Firmicutes bacterium]|nr:glycyl-radical enzyme activating protein family [Bacillota bacterium]
MENNTHLDKKKQGYIFNIQHYSVHDGPGIRTMVFLKGCPLQCQWCSNPESQKSHPELAYNIKKCIGLQECGRCVKACPHGAIQGLENNRITIVRENCQQCFRCATECPSKALHVFGVLKSVDEIIKIVEGDGAFYSRSGGGMTISGGEPFMQADFTIALLKEAKRRRINTAIETSGYVGWHILEEACKYLDTILFDIKSLDDQRHIEFTHVSNEIILNNFKKLYDDFPAITIIVRTPVIPGFNDSNEAITAIVNYVKDKPNVHYEILPYHRLGQPKYEYLGREYGLDGIKLDVEKEKNLRAIIKKVSY